MDNQRVISLVNNVQCLLELAPTEHGLAFNKLRECFCKHGIIVFVFRPRLFQLQHAGCKLVCFLRLGASVWHSLKIDGQFAVNICFLPVAFFFDLLGACGVKINLRLADIQQPLRFVIDAPDFLQALLGPNIVLHIVIWVHWVKNGFIIDCFH